MGDFYGDDSSDSTQGIAGSLITAFGQLGSTAILATTQPTVTTLPLNAGGSAYATGRTAQGSSSTLLLFAVLLIGVFAFFKMR